MDEAGFRFGLALRLAPALAPAVLEATEGARAANLMVVRGDAYRLAGHEPEARQAYAIAANGGLPERRSRVRPRPRVKPVVVDDDDELEGPSLIDGAMTDGSSPSARHRHDDDPDEILWDPAEIDAAPASSADAPDAAPSAATDPDARRSAPPARPTPTVPRTARPPDRGPLSDTIPARPARPYPR